MMKIRIKEEVKQNAIAFTISGLIILSVYFTIMNFSLIKVFLKDLILNLLPFILGFFFAFVLSNITVRLESGIMKSWKINDGLKRKISVTIALIIMILCLIGFVYILMNQVIVSVQTFISTMNTDMQKSIQYLEKLFQDFHLSQELFNWLVDNGQQAVNGTINLLKTQIPSILSYSWFAVTQVFNFFIALIVTTYILLDKEKFYLGTKRFLYAFLSNDQVEWLIDLSHISSHMFNSFIVGKTIDSIIIGIICYFGMLILKLDFAVLISFIVGVTNVIPIFGPFIGAIPGFIILLITSPQQSLIFLIWILVLQQFDGNILGPKILGDSMGLPTLWIMFAIITGGAYFGFVGMFLGVPVFSVVYHLVQREINKRLTEKRIKVE